jgi:hypothetical protein
MSGAAGSAGSTSGTGGSAGSTSGAGGGGGSSGGSQAAQTFCTQYETTCMFGGAMRFPTEAACISGYDGFSASRKTCVEDHLDMAEDDTGLHCPHATGLSTCI